MLLSIDVPTESRKTGLASTLLLVVVLVVIMMMMDHGAAASKAALSLASQLRRPADHHGTSWVGTLVRPHPSRQLALRRPRRMVAASPKLLARWACPSGRQHASTAKRERLEKEKETSVVSPLGSTVFLPVPVLDESFLARDQTSKEFRREEFAGRHASKGAEKKAVRP